MEFKVVKINQEFRNVVVSHKAPPSRPNSKPRSRSSCPSWRRARSSREPVKNITSYGAFVDLGGVDGLIHITDLSWSA